MTEQEMRDAQAYRQLCDAEQLISAAVKAQAVGMYHAAQEAATKAAYLAQGAAVMAKSLAEEKQREAQRHASHSAVSDSDNSRVRCLGPGCLDC